MTKEELGSIIIDIIWNTYDYDPDNGHSLDGDTIILELEKLGFQFVSKELR